MEKRVKQRKRLRRKSQNRSEERQHQGMSAAFTSTTSSPVQTMLALQQEAGNRAVGQLIQRGAEPTGTLPQIWTRVFRQEEESEASSDDAAEIDTSQFTREAELPGHGNNGGGNSGGTSSGTAAAGSSGVDATVTMTVNAPSEISKPEADIAQDHGRPGVAGWTTPKYNMQVPYLDSDEISVDVTLDFDIELASEYTGAALDVLSDHEQGHVIIGTKKADEHLKDGLEAGLETFPLFNASSPPAIQTTINNAANNFETAEGNESQSFDDSDYPRMQQAYMGANSSLSDLGETAPNIKKMAETIEDFNKALPLTDEANVDSLAQSLFEAESALSQDELSRLQYNPEFKALVTTCEARITAFIESYDWDLWFIEFSTLDDSAREALEMVRDTLGDFEWQAPV